MKKISALHLLAAMVALSFGCSGKGSPEGSGESVPVNKVTDPGACEATGTMIPPQCCPGGELTGDVAVCPALEPGPPMIPQSGTNRSPNAFDTARAALAAADSLSSTATTSALGGHLAEGEAATVGAGIPPSFTKGAGSANNNSGAPNLGSGGPGKSGSGGGGASGGGGMMTGFQSGGLTTRPNTSGSTPNATPSTSAASLAEGMYRANEGGGGYGNSAAGMGSFGGGGGGEENVVTEVDMNGTSGSDKAGAKEAPADPMDPADYFSRLGALDNLFKVIERRYGNKARGWLNDDLERIKTRGVKVIPSTPK